MLDTGNDERKMVHMNPTATHLATLASFGQDTGGFRVNNGGATALAEAITAVLAELAAAQAAQAKLAAVEAIINGTVKT